MSPSPRLPLGACVLALDENGQVLVVARRQDRHQVCLPGGKAEGGEAPRQAAARELAEETGIIADPESLVFLYQGQCEDEEGPAAHWVHLFGLPRLAREEEVSDPEGLSPGFVDCGALLDRSPFARFNAKALAQAEGEFALVGQWLDLKPAERLALERFGRTARAALTRPGRARPPATR